MTNEQKLQKLLQIAVDNGCSSNEIYYLLENSNIRINDEYFCVNNGMQYEQNKNISLNDLVDNWKKGEISFIEALCDTDHIAVVHELEKEDIILDSYGMWKYPNHIQVRFLCGLQETPNKLGWLFRIFAHLFEE